MILLMGTVCSALFQQMLEREANFMCVCSYILIRHEQRVNYEQSTIVKLVIIFVIRLIVKL
jgi:hypothetical protein